MVQARLSFAVVLGYSTGAFGGGLLPLIAGSWILYFYCPPNGVALLAPATLGAIRFAERLIGALLEPLFGHLSDRTRTRFGRRRPWMAMGLPLLCISFAALWFPPRGLPTDAAVTIAYAGTALFLFYASYTAVFAPYYALLPEIATSTRERLRISVWLSLSEVAANIAGSLGASPLIGLGAVAVAGISFANGFELLGVVAAGLAFLALLPVLLLVQEHPPTNGHARRFSFRQTLAEALRNRQFLGYGAAMVGFRAASMTAIISIPYLATQLMGLTEAQAPLMLATIILVASFSFGIVDRLANRYGKARVFRWGGVGLALVLPFTGTIGLVPGVAPLLHGGLLFAAAGFSVATMFVLPRALLADIIDLDAEHTGVRREATFTGMSGVMEKTGEAIATGMVGVIFEVFGYSSSHPLGLRLAGVAGALVLAAGLFGFRRYAIVK